MPKIYFETLKAAYGYAGGYVHHAKRSDIKTVRFVNLVALQQLCNPKRTTGQGWTFIGSTQDWKRCIQPYYNR